MARAKAGKEEGGTLGRLAAHLIDALGLAGLVAAEAKRIVERRAEAVLWRTVLLLTLTLWMSVGVFLMLMGLIHYLVEAAGLPAAAVHAGAGLGVLAVSSIWFFALRRRHGGARS
jgi:hypothetical protein